MKREVNSEQNSFDLTFHTPSTWSPPERISEIDACVSELKETKRLAFDSQDEKFRELASKEDIASGQVGLFSIGENAILALLRNSDEPFETRELKQLDGVFEKFALSLDANISHARLRDEVLHREKVEQDLSETETFFSQVMDQLPSQLACFDQECRYIYVSPSAIASEEVRKWVIGKTDLEYCAFRNIDESNARVRVETIRRVFETGETISFEETLVSRKDGSQKHFIRIISPVYNSVGERTRVIGYGVDITNSKNAVKARERFLANMSHEIRTPLNAIQGMTHLLFQTQPSERQSEYLKAVKYSAGSLLTIVDEILDFAKIESGEIGFESRPFDLEKVLSSLQDTFSFRADQKQISLNCSISKSVPRNLVGDSFRLTQVLSNLLANSLKFTNSGKVSIHVSGDSTDSEESKVTLLFKVSDTGIGIEPEKLGLIFQPFTQARDDTSRKYGGTGLGLSIVKEIVERQEGSVSVESEVNKGTVFTISIPYELSGEEVSAVKHGPSPTQEDLKGLSILVAEDNKINQTVVKDLLELWGARVVVVENGQDAVQVVKTDSFDLVLMDIQMPVLDGFGSTRLIREVLEKDSEELPILALTASVLQEQIDKMRLVGMNDVIRKPFDAEDLKQKILHFTARSENPVLPRPVTELGQRSEPIETAQVDLINLESLKRNVGGDESLMIKMLGFFKEQIPEMLDEIEKAFKEGRSEISKMAHKYKSSARTIGAEKLGASFAELERRSLDSETFEIESSSLESVLDQSKELETAIEMFLASR